jgi:hypothetical protein
MGRGVLTTAVFGSSNHPAPRQFKDPTEPGRHNGIRRLPDRYQDDAGETDNLRTCYSVPGDDGAVSPAPTWHTRALESVPLSGIVRRRDFIHAGHDSDRR